MFFFSFGSLNCYPGVKKRSTITLEKSYCFIGKIVMFKSDNFSSISSSLNPSLKLRLLSYPLFDIKYYIRLIFMSFHLKIGMPNRSMHHPLTILQKLIQTNTFAIYLYAHTLPTKNAPMSFFILKIIP